MIANTVLALAAIFIAAVVVELVPALKTLDAWMREHHGLLLAAIGALSLLGLLLLLGSVLMLLMGSGEPMTHTGVENQMRSQGDTASGAHAWRASSYRVIGSARGVEGHDEFSFAQLKAAIARGAVFRERAWRRRSIAIAGGMLLILGLLGFGMLISPMPLRLVLACAFAYAFVRIGWGLFRA